MQFLKEDLLEIQRQILRLDEMNKRLTTREKRRKDAEMKILTSLRRKLDSDFSKVENEVLQIPLNRNELRFLERILKMRLVMLTTSVIPGYEARMKQEPTNSSNYEPYLERAKMGADKCSELIKQVEKGLQ